ncbi:lantibiotic dehydratase [Actinokineospora globicatena]|uniref:Thiopeptide-type bacteriocin biosynthesis domain-containing protein n=1 Tax=Actinokineospora globicatena TaxID=103729 RepID=A0A9W6QIM3_9PSEU|nr:lantibiotic dehydratase [Actinokineospora globicatena]GLW90162.1 hypothetical protein Aglo03_09780 [Actinokineospora globicatena]
MSTDSKLLYRHTGAALLRAAARPLDEAQDDWPDLGDTESCRTWLKRTWSRSTFADAVRIASPTFAERLDSLDSLRPKEVRRAAATAIRYALRACTRHTPFGLFAGVASAEIGSPGMSRWGQGHHAVARVDSQWLAGVIARLEAEPVLLERLKVVFTNLAVERGSRLEAPCGPETVSIRLTGPVAVTRASASTPILFAELVDLLLAKYPNADRATITRMVSELVRQQVLITSLRAPLTVVDPLGHLLDQLHAAGAEYVAGLEALVDELCAVDVLIRQHNRHTLGDNQNRAVRIEIGRRMREVSTGGRTPLAIDLRLDCDVRVPEQVVRDVEDAATVLARLTAQPTGEPAWRDYYTVFCDRYGTGTLVPLTEVVHPDSGLGFPSGYPGSVRPSSLRTGSDRDKTLLSLAWTALADRRREIVLDEPVIESLMVSEATQPRYPAHVEVAARIHATDINALDQGDYLLTITPGRSLGTFTSRFATIAPGTDLRRIYASVPTAARQAVPAQLSFPPVYAHAENVCRVPKYLPDVLSLGEHRSDAAVALDDLAVTATRDGFRLVSLTSQRIIEPQAFHGLALQKQSPPLARFLAHLSRGLQASWHKFDWGGHANQMPYLPRIRHGRAILSHARWRLASADAPSLESWRERWGVPDLVELAADDRSLRLDLNEPTHVALLVAHMERTGDATLVETINDPGELGWIGGFAHEIVFPLTSTQAPASAPTGATARRISCRTHGVVPGAPTAAWLNAKLHTHPQRINEIITDRLPTLLDPLGGPPFWFVRYRSATETDHLRLRLPADGTDVQVALGRWAEALRRDGAISRLVLDTYFPEVGRYGAGEAMAAAEDVFVADSQATVAQLRYLPEQREAMVVVNMVATVCGLLEGEVAVQWLVDHPAPPGPAIDRPLFDQVLALLRGPATSPPDGWNQTLIQTWERRAEALAAYRSHLTDDDQVDTAVESLLHMHHNRLIGVDRDYEIRCRRLVRQVALTWAHRRGGSR